METFEYFLFGFVILGFLFGSLVFYLKEKKAWNGGRCPKCGAKLTKIHGDTKGYMCESCREYWIWFTIFEPKEPDEN